LIPHPGKRPNVPYLQGADVHLAILADEHRFAVAAYAILLNGARPPLAGHDLEEDGVVFDALACR
jgi:hypothetical protein